jgi:hypothetical protein
MQRNFVEKNRVVIDSFKDNRTRKLAKNVLKALEACNQCVLA